MTHLPTSGGGRDQLRAATSTDGLAWEYTSPAILREGPDTISFFGHPVASDGSSWVELYSLNGDVLAARSGDGVAWTESEKLWPRAGVAGRWGVNNLAVDDAGRWLAVGTGPDPGGLGDKDLFVYLGTDTPTCGDGRVEGTEQCDPPGDCCGADCRFSAAGTECRPAAGLCDAVETCTGTDAACPADVKKPNGEICREAAGPCAERETCGGGNDCPADSFVIPGRPSCSDDDACTDVDTCDGAGGCSPGVRVCEATATPAFSRRNKLKGIQVLCESREKGQCEATALLAGTAPVPAAAFEPLAKPRKERFATAITKTARRRLGGPNNTTILTLKLNRLGRDRLRNGASIDADVRVSIGARGTTPRIVLRRVVGLLLQR
jgi:hypothetical protein